MTHLFGKKDSSKEDVVIEFDAKMQKKREPVMSNQMSELSSRYSHEKTDVKCKLINFYQLDLLFRLCKPLTLFLNC